MAKKPERSSRVPSGRLERLARMGWLTGGMAVGGATEGIRRMFGGDDSPASAFLNSTNAERLAQHLSRMRGAAMKVGQMLSMVDDQMLPPEFASALAILRDSADMMPEKQVRKVLEREYGVAWGRQFREFDFEPIAAASIGQVHLAIAADGRELALKIQYPGVAESIDSDVSNLAIALRAARILPGDLDLDPIAEEAKVQLRQEADYEQEASFLARYRECVGGDSRFRVPDVFPELTTTHILAMERLHGVPLEDLTGPEHSQEQRDELCARLLELLVRELFEFGLMQTDPNFSNYLLLADKETVGLLDFGSTQEVAPELASTYRRLIGSIRHRDRDALRQLCLELGSLRDSDSPESVECFMDLLSLIYEPFASDGIYEFGVGDLFVRAQKLGMELAFTHGFLRAPPPQTIFAQRKLDGMMMLCSRLKARVDVGALVAPYLD